MIAKSRSNTDAFIKDHAFSILKIYNVIAKGLDDPDFPDFNTLTFFYLYNVWGQMQQDLIDISSKRKILAQAIEQINVNTAENDGRFLIEYSTILKFFKKIDIYETYENYEVKTNKIDFLDSQAEFEVQFTLNSNSNSKCFLFFNLRNLNEIDPLFPQIQPYTIESLNISPQMANSTKYLEAGDVNNMIYKGMSFHRLGGNSDYTLKFTLKKFNYDIVDHIFMSFYVPKNTLQILNVSVSKKKESCPEECNQNGICNTFQQACTCKPKVIY